MMTEPITEAEFRQKATVLDKALNTTIEKLSAECPLVGALALINTGVARTPENLEMFNTTEEAYKIGVEISNLQNEIKNNHYLPDSPFDKQKAETLDYFAGQLKNTWKAVKYKPDRTDPNFKAYFETFVEGKEKKGVLTHHFEKAVGKVDNMAKKAGLPTSTEISKEASKAVGKMFKKK